MSMVINAICLLSPLKYVLKFPTNTIETKGQKYKCATKFYTSRSKFCSFKMNQFGWKCFKLKCQDWSFKLKTPRILHFTDYVMRRDEYSLCHNRHNLCQSDSMDCRPFNNYSHQTNVNEYIF